MSPGPQLQLLPPRLPAAFPGPVPDCWGATSDHYLGLGLLLELEVRPGLGWSLAGGGRAGTSTS